MMLHMGYDLNNKTKALYTSSPQPMILDLCIAPGGFAAVALNKNPRAHLCAITLSLSRGGHGIKMREWPHNGKIICKFHDITMLANEMGVRVIHAEHPDARKFIRSRPFYGVLFDIVIFGEEVLRTHRRAEYRESREPWRLTTSQLVLALRRTCTKGKIIMLLHEVDSWSTISLLHTLGRFLKLKLFKPSRNHAIRSDFDVVAWRVQPTSTAARAAVEFWKKEWHRATFTLSDKDYQATDPQLQEGVEDHVKSVLEDFGPQLIKLATPIWEIQKNALSEVLSMER